MVTKWSPEPNKVHLIEAYTLLHILEGRAIAEVDFKTYPDLQDRLIYLSKGQYIKFPGEGVVCRKITFDDETLFKNHDVRVLFKHLVGLGYIDFDECSDCQRFLDSTILAKNPTDIIDISTEQWFWQDPFHASREEYHVIFDVKEVIDREFSKHLRTADVAAMLNGVGYDAIRLVNDKVGISVSELMRKKRLDEGKHKIAFTDKSAKEVSYELGYKDPSYFNRDFKKGTGKSPMQFRNDMDVEGRDTFVQDITALIKKHHTQNRALDLYADQMHLSVKALSKKVKDRMNLSLGQLIRMEVMNTGKKMLQDGAQVKEVADLLGFEEANHFSAFFKRYQGESPTQFASR